MEKIQRLEKIQRAKKHPSQKLREKKGFTFSLMYRSKFLLIVKLKI